MKGSTISLALGGAAILATWCDELLDLPHRLFMTPATPVNTAECFIETAIILPLSVLLWHRCRRTEHRVRTLEGWYSICANCHRVRVQGRWIKLEEFLTQGSQVNLSHGICWSCLEQQDPEVYARLRNNPDGPPS